jgi:hypothetical protein
MIEPSDEQMAVTEHEVMTPYKRGIDRGADAMRDRQVLTKDKS